MAKTAKTNVVGVMNAIRALAGVEYQSRVPIATQTNIEEVGNPLITYESTRNDFLTLLLNKIGMTIIENKRFLNPLARLKSGAMPIGKDIEELYINPATASTFDPTGANLMPRSQPDVKVGYHRLNRRDEYKVTIQEAEFRLAFKSWDALGKMIDGIILSMYNGDNIDEFILMKNLFYRAYNSGKIDKINVATPIDDSTAKGFIKLVRGTAKKLIYPSTEFVPYNLMKPAEDTRPDAICWSGDLSKEILLIRSDVINEVDVEVLARAFNMNMTDFLGNVIEVDDFGDPALLAVLCDESFPKVYDYLNLMGHQFINGSGLYRNLFYHHQQTYSFSPFGKAVAFYDETKVVTPAPLPAGITEDETTSPEVAP